jgi:NMD protein affecting ribosome stability and mRNA decay
MEGSVLNLAQHATATCCRKCLYYWYGVPRNRPLDGRELDFCESMVLAYLERRKGELRAIETGAANGGDRV